MQEILLELTRRMCVTARDSASNPNAPKGSVPIQRLTKNTGLYTVQLRRCMHDGVATAVRAIVYTSWLINCRASRHAVVSRRTARITHAWAHRVAICGGVGDRRSIWSTEACCATHLGITISVADRTPAFAVPAPYAPPHTAPRYTPEPGQWQWQRNTKAV